MKKYVLVVVVMLLTGCNQAYERTPEVVPDDLKDCKFYVIFRDGTQLNVIRCPHSDTSVNYRSGKSPHTVVVTDY